MEKMGRKRRFKTDRKGYSSLQCRVSQIECSRIQEMDSFRIMDVGTVLTSQRNTPGIQLCASLKD